MATEKVSLREAIWRTGGGSGEFRHRLGVELGHIEQADETESPEAIAEARQILWQRVTELERAMTKFTDVLTGTSKAERGYAFYSWQRVLQLIVELTERSKPESPEEIRHGVEFTNLVTAATAVEPYCICCRSANVTLCQNSIARWVQCNNERCGMSHHVSMHPELAQFFETPVWGAKS